MYGFILKRLVATIPVMGVVALVVFLMLRLAPGDPAAVLAGDAASPEMIARIRAALGLDEPIHTQFVIWMGRLLRGDLGTSIISNVPVTTMIQQRHETLSRFFSVLGIDPETQRQDIEGIEHHLSPETVAVLSDLAAFFEKNPATLEKFRRSRPAMSSAK